MSVSPRHAGGLFSAAVMFTMVSVLSGVLIAGLAVPFAALSGWASTRAAEGLQMLPEDLATPPAPERSIIYLGNGEILTYFFDENRINVQLNDIAPVMQQAIIAIEDHRFYEHGAMDTQTTLKQFVLNQTGDSSAGASSITQQYVKMVQIQRANLNGDRKGVQKAQEPTYTRKIQELRYAIALEKRLIETNKGDVRKAKDAILEGYLNIAYFGQGVYGVEAAANLYFNTSAKNLNLAQAAFLAGMVQDPVNVNPISDERKATARRDVVINRMAQLGLIKKEAADEAKKMKFDESKVRRVRQGCQGSRYPFLCDFVKRSLLEVPSLGANRTEREQRINRGGLRIYTKIDPRTQDAAQKSISNFVKATDPVISVANVVEPGTGLILAMAQSRTVMGANKAAGETYYNYSVTPQLGGAEGFQAGSTFKLYALAAALEQGVPMDKTFPAPQTMDFSNFTWRTCDGPMKLSGTWRVKNSTGAAPTMNLATATGRSTNTYYVQLEALAGMCNTTKMAERTGVKLSAGETFETWSTRPSFVLGSAEVAPLSVAASYATFAARGKRCDPYIVEKVIHKSGRKFDTPTGNCKQVVEPKVADGVNKMLAGVMRKGMTGYPATIPGGYPQAGKTGTTDEGAAVWFAGFTPEIAGVAMVSKDNTAPLFKKDARGRAKRLGISGLRLGPGRTIDGSGARDAGARIYRPMMTTALQGKPKTPFVQPPAKIREPRKVIVPPVRGLSVAQMTQKLTGEGFSVVRASRVSSARKGTYLGISPRPGSRVDEGTTITIVFSSGPPPARQPARPPASPTNPNQTVPQTSQNPSGSQTQPQNQSQNPQTQNPGGGPTGQTNPSNPGGGPSTQPSKEQN